MASLTARGAVRRLHDRLGFALGGDALVAAQRRSYAANVAALLHPKGRDAGVVATPPPQFPELPRPQGDDALPGAPVLKAYRRQLREQVDTLSWWWLDRMVAVEQPTPERLTWFWHGHFATSSQKVKDARFMLAQNETFRRLALDRFEPLAQGLIIDPAMLVWLDGNDNTKAAPNENLSREFMELFTLGRGAYTETDVREAARALTGWKIDRSAVQPVFRPGQHDDGEKHIFGRTADYDAASFVTLALSQPPSAAFVIGRLWFRLVSPTAPSTAARKRLVKAYGSRRDLTALLLAITAEPAFRDVRSSLVKQPVEWVVGLMRALGVRPSTLTAGQRRRVEVLLRGLGQIPFAPPSVGGWPAGASWLTTAAALNRVELARLLAAAATLPDAAQRLSVAARPDYLRRLLGVEGFSPRTVAAITASADAWPAAIAVAACSPEYLVSV